MLIPLRQSEDERGCIPVFCLFFSNSLYISFMVCTLSPWGVSNNHLNQDIIGLPSLLSVRSAVHYHLATIDQGGIRNEYK